MNGVLKGNLSRSNVRGLLASINENIGSEKLCLSTGGFTVDVIIVQ